MYLEKKKVTLKTGQEIECYEGELVELEKAGLIAKQKKAKPITKEEKQVKETKAGTITSKSFNQG